MPTPRFLLVFALGASPVAAQQLPKPPSDSVLAAITARGRMLLHYDIAAWHGGDAIIALKPAPGEVTTSLAFRNPDGSWAVGYGHLSARKDTFYTVYRAVQTDADSGFTASRDAKPLANTGGLREMALAIETAKRQFGTITRPFNTYILPATGGGLWVYFMPAQTDPRAFPLGGDVRYHIIGGTTIADSMRFHRTILERQTGFKPDGGQQVASMHTSFDTLPSESDVFVVLRQAPHLPEVVVTKDFSYEIQIDGSIRWQRMGQIPQVTIDSSALALPHIPVWKTKVDTVGTAPRMMALGYTEWRDTTTGWRMSFERFVKVHGADSGSYNGSYRTLTLDDGRMLVTRGSPATAIQLYDVDGKFVRDIGRVGTGPDDFVTTPTLAMKGDTLIALDGIQSKMMLFALDGRLIRSFRIRARGAPLPIGVDPRGLIRVQQQYGLGLGDTLSRKQWVYYNTRGEVIDSIRRPELPLPKSWRVLDGTTSMEFQVPFSSAVADLFLPDGSLMYGVGNRFQFFVTKRGRDTTRIFGRSDILAVGVPPGFADSTFDQMTRELPLMKSAMKRADMPVNYPLWNSVIVDNLGYTWVSSGFRGRTNANVSIFAPDGRYLGIAPLYWDRFDGMSFGGDRMSYVTFDKDRTPVLRIYKVDRRGMQ